MSDDEIKDDELSEGEVIPKGFHVSGGVDEEIAGDVDGIDSIEEDEEETVGTDDDEDEEY